MQHTVDQMRKLEGMLHDDWVKELPASQLVDIVAKKIDYSNLDLSGE